MQTPKNKTRQRTITHRLKKIGAVVAVGNDQERWLLLESQVIDDIEKGRCRYAVGSGSTRSNIEVVHRRRGRPYLRSHPDGTEANNLDHLPRF